MTWLDHFLQRQRIAQARSFLAPGARVLDIGSADGALFQAVDFLGAGCVGIVMGARSLGTFLSRESSG